MLKRMLLRCTAVDCGLPDGVHRAKLVSVKSTMYNSSVTFQCFSGYWFSRDQYAVSSACDADARWSALPFDRCRR